MIPPGTVVFYAQVKQPRDLPPVARVLMGKVLRPSRLADHTRVSFPHARRGLDVETAWLVRSPEAATQLLRSRILVEIRALTYRVRLLRHAWKKSADNLLIVWPPPAPVPPPEQLIAPKKLPRAPEDAAVD